MRSNKENKEILDYLFSEFSIIYGATWDSRVSNDEKTKKQRAIWSRVLLRMNKTQLRRALDAIQNTPSPHPTYPPPPLVFKDLGYSPHDKSFKGECCYSVDGKQCRSRINVHEKIENGVKKMYCTDHYGSRMTKAEEENLSKRNKKLAGIGVDPTDIFAIMISKKIPLMRKTFCKKLSKYTKDQLESAVKINNSVYCKK